MKRFLLAFLFLSLFAARVHAQATVQLAPVPHQQFFGANGIPLALGCVYSYSAGTTTFLATYKDSTGTVQNSDPIQLDLGGFADIWLTGSAYKLAVYSNTGGGPCPGTPGGVLVSQWTVDNITTATGSSGGAASQLTSAGANPATTGLVEATKSDSICWRNVGNSGNLCLSLDSTNNLTWSFTSFALTEGAAPTCVAGEDITWADSTAHRLKMCNNNGAAKQIVASGADINTSDQVTVTHLASALPTAQGGTGSTSASTGSGGVVLATSPALTSPALTTPTIGGTTITNVPRMAWSAWFSASAWPINSAAAIFTSPTAITINYFSVQLWTAFSGCTQNPVWEIFDETGSSVLATLTEINGTTTYESTGLSAGVTANHRISFRANPPLGTGCSGGGSGIITAGYTMQ